MKHPRILHIETATNVCSVVLSEGEKQLAIRESNEDKSHGSLLSVFMGEVLSEAGYKPGDMHAISVSKGPGSYTGLRIGVSAVKGFSYALELPIIGIDTLLALAIGAQSTSAAQKLITRHPDLLLCPLLDARRMEVYSGFYTLEHKSFRKVSADIIDENSYKEILEAQPVLFFGNGAFKVKESIHHPNAFFIDDIEPSAKNMILTSLELYEKRDFEDAAYFEPYYLKDFVATTPKKKIL